MRVTQNMLNRSLVSSMGRNYEQLSDITLRLATGQRVNTVSDDVLAARSIMSLRRMNEQVETYMRNLEEARSTMTVACTSIEQMSEVLTGVDQVAIQAANGTYSDSDRQLMAASLDGMLESLVTVANARGSKGYVFSGEATDRRSFEVVENAAGQITEVRYNGEMVSTSVNTGPASTAEVNLVGETVMNRTGSLFETVINMRDAVAAGDLDRIEDLLGELGDRHTDVAQAIGVLGERISQFDVLEQSTEAFRALNEELVSKEQDADIGEDSVEYNTQMALVQMVMKLASQATMPSIISYL